MYTEVFFDIETKKIFEDVGSYNPADLGISIVSVYKREINDSYKEINGQMYSFWEEDFPKMWPLFTNASRVIGFNSFHFDNPALAAHSPFDFNKLNHFDILDQVKNVLGFRLSLHSLATATLNHSKIDHGLNAVKYWNEHSEESLGKLKMYCEADVAVTRDVYDYALQHKSLKYLDKWNTLRMFDVDFSYPKVEESAQIGLF